MLLLVRLANYCQPRLLRLATNQGKCFRFNSKSSNSLLLTRRIKQKVTERGKELNSSWNMIYRNPFIFPLTLLVRFKLYHTALCIFVSSYCVHNYIDGSLSDSQFAFTIFTLIGVLILLIGYSILYQRLVGLIYLSKDSKHIRLAHLNFWGRRVDSTCPVDKIVPLSDTNERLNTLHVKISRTDSDQTYYMNFGAKSILNPKAFEMVFGHSPHPNFYDDNALELYNEQLKNKSSNQTNQTTNSNDQRN